MSDNFTADETGSVDVDDDLPAAGNAAEDELVADTAAEATDAPVVTDEPPATDEPNAADAEGFRALQAENQKIKEAIEAAWDRAGLPTFLRYLREYIDNQSVPPSGPSVV